MTESVTWRNTPFAKRFYKSKAWQDVRALVLERAHGLCEECAERGDVVLADVVHHKTPLSVDNMDDLSVTLSPDSLVALCNDCHTKAHRELGIGALNGKERHDETSEQRVRFDAKGDVVRLPGSSRWAP